MEWGFVCMIDYVCYCVVLVLKEIGLLLYVNVGVFD